MRFATFQGGLNESIVGLIATSLALQVSSMDVNLRSSALHKAMSGELREAEVDIVLPVQASPWSQLRSYA